MSGDQPSSSHALFRVLWPQLLYSILQRTPLHKQHRCLPAYERRTQRKAAALGLVGVFGSARGLGKGPCW